MKCFEIDLQKEYGTQGGVLECLVWDKPVDVVENWKRPALIVVPGGGYGKVSRREAEPVAFAFMAKGFQTFILNYAVRPRI